MRVKRNDFLQKWSCTGLSRISNASFLASFLCVGQAISGVCSEGSAFSSPFEEQKFYFLDGDYEQFLISANKLSNLPQDQKTSILSSLSDLYPDGFNTCELLISRNYPPKGFAELMLYTTVEGEGLFVGWVGFESDAGAFIGKYWISTEFGDLSGFWR